MSRPRLSSIALLLVTASLCACGEEAPALAERAPEELGDASATADCDPDSVLVGGGGPRVSRTAAVYVAHGARPADMRVWVSGPSGKVAGDLYARPGQTAFLPVQPFPANTTMTWSVRMCGEVFTGTFRTGSLISPVPADFDDEVVGHSFAVDLRVGAWSAPFDSTAERLVYRLGGAFVVDVVEREGEVLRVAVTPAKPDNAGGYERVAGAVPQVFDASFASDPYAILDAATLALPTNAGMVTLNNALLGLGFGNDGIADAFLEATLETDEETCLLLDAAGAPCGPCHEGDEDGTCVTLSVEGLYGLSL